MFKNGNTYKFLFFLAIFLPVLLLISFWTSAPAQAAISTITATVNVGVCGNNIVEFGEECDGSALDGQTCESLGWDAGTLACDPSCEFDESDCIDLGPDEGGINFTGSAYPNSVVKILKDGQIAATTAANPTGNFEVSISDIIVGSYIFSLYAYDSNGNKSKTISYPRTITKDGVEKISNIIIPPTLVANLSTVAKGDNITFSGQSAKREQVNFNLASGSNNWLTNTTTGDNGFFSYQIDTDTYNLGDYSVSAKTTLNNGLSSEYSDSVSFQIGEAAEETNENTNENENTNDNESETASTATATGWKAVDFNNDSRINLIDFSILIHWFGSNNPPVNIDINKDNNVNLSDFSVLMYYWTG